MTEVTQNENIQSDEGIKLSLKNTTQIVYICQALSFLLGITAVAGVIINYIKQDAVKDTWLESHFKWQIRTFWFGLLWGVIGAVLSVVLIGVFIIVADWVWVIYRVIKGWLALLEHKSMYYGAK